MLENPGFDEKSSDKDRVGRKGGSQFLEWNIILLHIFTQTELVESKDENRALKLGNKWARNVSSKYVTLQGSGQSYVTCLRTMDSSPNLRLCKSNSSPLQGPSLIHYVSSRNRPRNCRFGSIIPLSLSLSHFREEINRWPGSKKRINQWRDYRAKNYDEFSPKKEWKIPIFQITRFLSYV